MQRTFFIILAFYNFSINTILIIKLPQSPPVKSCFKKDGATKKNKKVHFEEQFNIHYTYDYNENSKSNYEVPIKIKKTNNESPIEILI